MAAIHLFQRSTEFFYPPAKERSYEVILCHVTEYFGKKVVLRAGLTFEEALAFIDWLAAQQWAGFEPCASPLEGDSFRLLGEWS